VPRRRKPRKARRGDGWFLPWPYLIGALVGGAIVATALLGGGQPRLDRHRAKTLRPLDPLRTAAREYPWTTHPPAAFPVPPYARFLDGVQIVLDPGHGGQRDPGGTWKRGPTGLREAEVNLRVAQFLREFLDAVGAKVVLTRTEDRSLDLPDKEDFRQRAAVANELRADLFLSIHHNANDKPEPNYTSVFYHGAAGDNPASVAAGRFLLAGLNDALRLETHLECALLSDFAVYDRNGFAVLRLAEVPAVLTEASFHSNPEEERRLRDPVYNRREAYGLFLGLARWAQAGLPRVALLEPGNGAAKRGGEATVGLDDGLSARGGWGADQNRILPDSVVVRVDGQAARFRLDLGKRQLRVTLPAVKGDTCTLWVDFENVFGQHVLHPELRVSLRGR
jgi:N-acetylmuramoyl-L-alanine amidase